MPSPMSEVTLAVRDFTAMRDFFESLGWQVRSQTGEWCRFETSGSTSFALYGLSGYDQGQFELPPLAEDGTFRGFSIACTVTSRASVDAAYPVVQASSAKVLHEPSPTPWGGYSFHFLDPEGNLWAITHAP